MARKINLKCEHSRVKTLNPFEQAVVFPSKQRSKSAPKRALQLIKDAIKTRQREGVILRRRQLRGDVVLPAVYSSSMSLAHLLFPNNFPKMIATGLKKPALPHSIITYSKLVPLTQESQKGIDSFYIDIRKNRVADAWKVPYHAYSTKYYTQMRNAASKIEESGLLLNDQPMNVGIRNVNGKKEFVFFEVDEINLPKLALHVQKLPQKTGEQKLAKAQARALLDFIKTQPHKGEKISVHYQLKRELKKLAKP